MAEANPECKLFTRSPMPESDVSLSSDMIEVSTSSDGKKFPYPVMPTFLTSNISTKPFLQTEYGPEESFVETININEIKEFIPDNNPDISNFLLMRMPEINKMCMSVKALERNANNHYSSFRICLEEIDRSKYSFTAEESKLVETYIITNTILANHSKRILDFATDLVRDFVAVLEWCVYAPADFRKERLDTTNERLTRRSLSLHEMVHIINEILKSFRNFPYKNKITCLILLTCEISNKNQELQVEIRNLSYYLNKITGSNALKIF